jgi:hypothetical protein
MAKRKTRKDGGRAKTKTRSPSSNNGTPPSSSSTSVGTSPRPTSNLSSQEWISIKALKGVSLAVLFVILLFLALRIVTSPLPLSLELILSFLQSGDPIVYLTLFTIVIIIFFALSTWVLFELDIFFPWLLDKADSLYDNICFLVYEGKPAPKKVPTLRSSNSRENKTFHLDLFLSVLTSILLVFALSVSVIRWHQVQMPMILNQSAPPQESPLAPPAPDSPLETPEL